MTSGINMEDVRILIVDDDPGALETLVDIFEEMGYRAEAAASGEQALQKIAGRFFNVALLDIRLPDMEGTELLTRLRQLHPDTDCIITTGYASKDTSIQAINEGAFAYIEKPLDMAKVSATIQQAVDKQKLESYNRHLLARLKALEDVTDSALSKLELDDLLGTLLERAVVHLRANAGAILLLDESGKRLEIRKFWGPEGADRSPISLPVDASFAGRVLREGTSLVARGEDLDPETSAPYLFRRGIQSILGVPMRARGEMIGVAHIDRLSPDEFTADEIGLFEKLADRAAILIDHARLYEEQRSMAERQRRAAEEAQTLYEVAQSLVAKMGLTERLQLIAGHLARVTGAPRCMIGLLERDSLVIEFISGGDERESERIEMDEMGPDLRHALETGAAWIVRDAPSGELTTTELPKRHNIRSVLLLPLAYMGRVIGVIGMDEPGTIRDFTNDERRLGQIIAGQAAVAIENARTFEQQRAIASELQESLLPAEPPAIPGFDVQPKYEPAYALAQVGGDYFDFIELGDGRFGIVMGDVCGKGVTAAVYTAMSKYMLRAYAAEDPAPDRVMTRLNAALFNQMSEECMFITIVYGVLDTRAGTFTYANAAHPHPLLYDPRHETFEELATTGGMVGAIPTMEYEARTVTLPLGSVLALFTDGVTEARTGSQMLEMAGVRQVIAACARCTAAEIAEEIYQAALRQSGGSLTDDVAIVILKRVGESTPDG
jgi:serine phosphatase RsbU (regulator of sigma subunit)/CheY-like chemotaxis protein